jgi:hypothetical protein
MSSSNNINNSVSPEMHKSIYESEDEDWTDGEVASIESSLDLSSFKHQLYKRSIMNQTNEEVKHNEIIDNISGESIWFSDCDDDQKQTTINSICHIVDIATNSEPKETLNNTDLLDCRILKKANISA